MPNYQTLMNHLENLCLLPGIANHETQVAQYMEQHMQPFCDAIVRDNLGSVFALKKSKVKNALKVMVAAHMDEVGFIVKDINAIGNLKIAPVGGWWAQVLMASPISLYNAQGQRFKGVIGSIPPHLLTPEKRNQVVDIDDLLVDIGMTSKAQVLEHGINVGDMIVLDSEFNILNEQRIMSKAIDNRYGCAMSLTLLEALQDVDLPYDLYIGATVQEEVGLRGAQTAAYKLDPDVAIIFDCSPANDADGNQDELGRLGEGVLLRFVDRSMMPNRCFLKLLKDTCIEHDIPHQYYLSLGGTDAGAIHKSKAGVPTLSLCVVARNIHTNHAIVDISDIHHAFDSAQALLQKLNENIIFDIMKCNQ
ncbi:MAG: M42 family metallopeptidase [Erysipelothrix sp.]|jgi:putative aminopeptidase FrvX|nr:M42 family metallopeptidase [Erysipelothrix sp.]